MTTDLENLTRLHTATYINTNFKKCKTPHIRLGYEYNNLLDWHSQLHTLYVQQLYKIADLQDEVDRLHDLMHKHTTVEKCQGFTTRLV